MKPLPNVPKVLCNALIGAHHTPLHRYSAGLVVMVVGVYVAKNPLHGAIGHYISDCIGYFVHGLGAVPFIEGLIGGEEA